jgi:uncharacterized protein YsxB (DUF464 family)
MISDIICAAIGIVLFVSFLGIIVWWVKPLPLAIIALGVVGMMVYDLVLSVRQANNNR